MSCASDIPQWVETASADLLALQNADGGWPYRAMDTSSTEPTALAILALNGFAPAASNLATAGEWLAARQRSDGLFAAAPVHEEASWVSPLAAIALDLLGQPSTATA